MRMTMKLHSTHMQQQSSVHCALDCAQYAVPFTTLRVCTEHAPGDRPLTVDSWTTWTHVCLMTHDS